MITIKTIDQYLWLAGICNALDQNPNAQVNGIIKMKRNDPLFKVLFDRLQGKTGE